MPRIRSLKPEFWSSPGLPEDPWARLLYMAMWNWADDNGVGTANLRELLGFAFPNDPCMTLVDFRRVLGEIHRVFGVMFYTVAGRPYYYIPSWERHQKFDRRSKGRHPMPRDADGVFDLHEYDDSLQSHEPSTESHESPSSTRRDSAAGTGEQGNRGTEEKGKTRPTQAPNAADAADASEGFADFWAAYPRHEGRGAAMRAYAKARTKAEDSLLVQAALRYAQDPNREDRYTAHASTWLNGERWCDDPLPSRRNRISGQDEKVLGWHNVINSSPIPELPKGKP